MTIKVNGEVIPEEAINFELNRLIQFYSGFMSEDQIRQQLPALKEKAKEQAVGAKLLIIEAMRLDMKVAGADIDKKFEEIAKQAGGKDALDKLLKSKNLSEKYVRDNIERGRKVDMLVEQVYHEVEDPTEEEMKEHFKEHAAEYSKPERAQAQHILIKCDPKDDKEMAVARSRLMEIKSQIENGSKFAELAVIHSDCPSGKKAGGSLGWFSRGMMVPEFDQAVFSMQIGELSEIVQTQFGVHIIYKTGHEDAAKAEYKEAADKIKEFLRHAKRGAAISAFVDELKQKARIEES